MPKEARNNSINTDEYKSLLEDGQHVEKTNSWFSSSSLIVCTMAGVGVLGIPSAMQNSGWSGIFLLIVCAITNIYTGLILGRTMLKMPGRVRDYAEVGQEAFGLWGRRIAQFSAYSTSVGVGIIFMILLGILMNGIVNSVPPAFWTFVLALVILMPVSVGLRTLGEIKIVAWLGFSATVVVVIVSVIMSAIFYHSSDYEIHNQNDHFNHEFINMDKFPIAFSVFTFAFGATFVFPGVFVKLANKDDWPKAVAAAYTASCGLYFPVAVAGYLTYGTVLSKYSTILAVIEEYSPSSGHVIVKICSAIMIGHVVSAFPILMNQIFLALEEQVLGEKREYFVPRAAVRIGLFLVMLVVAMFFPYFVDIMGLVSCISLTMTGYILPSLFYWKICNPGALEKVWLVFVLVFGILGSIVGIIVNVQQLIDDVRANPDPFSGIFTFK